MKARFEHQDDINLLISLPLPKRTAKGKERWKRATGKNLERCAGAAEDRGRREITAGLERIDSIPLQSLSKRMEWNAAVTQNDTEGLVREQALENRASAVAAAASGTSSTPKV
jgi:hypothetical protein